jgi:hypothetical protein
MLTDDFGPPIWEQLQRKLGMLEPWRRAQTSDLGAMEVMKGEGGCDDRKQFQASEPLPSPRTRVVNGLKAEWREQRDSKRNDNAQRFGPLDRKGMFCTCP